MNVIIDSCIWSVVHRRRNPDPLISEKVGALIAGSRVCMLGAIRQECLSGIAEPNQYESLRTFLRTFKDFSLVTEHHELAASFYNKCRSKGIAGSHVDFLICAVAFQAQLMIYTSDQDFDRYAIHIPIRRFT